MGPTPVGRQGHPAPPNARDVLHVDFLRVTEDQQIEVNVPVVLQGEARLVTQFDGMVDQTMYEMAILVKPTAVPQEIVIDISDLELGATVKVADVILPEGAESAMDPDETVATALITRSTREAIRRASRAKPLRLKGLKALKGPTKATRATRARAATRANARPA